MALGVFSVSFAVQDLNVSESFYEKLGVSHWLFQVMFGISLAPILQPLQSFHSPGEEMYLGNLRQVSALLKI